MDDCLGETETETETEVEKAELTTHFVSLGPFGYPSALCVTRKEKKLHIGI